MTNRKTVYVDMDGVLVDLTPTWLRLYGEQTGEWIHPDEITSYEFEQFVSEPEIFFDCLQKALDVATPMPGSAKFMDLVNDPRLDVFIVTYAHGSATDAHRAKLHWLERYFPDFPLTRVIFTGHKHLLRGDVLIEDSPKNLQNWIEANPAGMEILVDQPYNREYSADCRVGTFAEVPMMIDAFIEAETGFTTKEEFHASK